MNTIYLYLQKIIFSTFFILFLTCPAFSEEQLPIVDKKPEENSDFLSKKINIELGISGMMLQTKAIFLLNDNIYPFVRFGVGGVASRRVQYLSSSGFDIETGVKYNFVIIKNKQKGFLSDFYLKFFGGATKTFASELVIFPFGGVGFGFSTINKFLGFSIGVDLGSSFEYFPGSGLGGVIFLRPEINVGYVF